MAFMHSLLKTLIEVTYRIDKRYHAKLQKLYVCNQIQIRHQNWFDSLVNSACKGTLATTTYIFLVDVVSVATIWAAAQ